MQPTTPAPVFLLAVPRSYSTVASAMLGGHPRLWVYPETGLLTATTVSSLLRGDPFRHLPAGFAADRTTGLLRAVAEINEKDQDPDAIKRAEDWLVERGDWTGAQMLAHLVDAVAPAVAVEKSTDASYAATCLDSYLGFHPQARFLHVIRHPMASQRSIQRLVGSISDHDMSLRERAHFANESWWRGNQLLSDRLAELPAEQSLRVRGEDLVGKPRATLAAVAQWLGLDSDHATIDAMMDTERWNFAHVGSDGSLFGGDRSFMEDPRLRPVVDPGPLEFPESWGIDPAAQRRTIELAERFGY